MYGMLVGFVCLVWCCLVGVVVGSCFSVCVWWYLVFVGSCVFGSGIVVWVCVDFLGVW